MNTEVRVRYHDKNITPLAMIDKGDWIDVRASNFIRNNATDSVWEVSAHEVSYKAGDIIKISLGFALELPKGFEAHIVPRSSTFKNYGLMQTNSVGIIDNAYCGDDDIWFIEFIAIRDGKVKHDERIAQFKIVPKMHQALGSIEFNEVLTLGNANRGGHGSTGVN